MWGSPSPRREGSPRRFLLLPQQPVGISDGVCPKCGKDNMSPPSDGDGRLLSPQSIVAKVFTGFLLGLGFAIPFFSIEAISSYFMARAFRRGSRRPASSSSGL